MEERIMEIIRSWYDDFNGDITFELVEEIIEHTSNAIDTYCGDSTNLENELKILEEFAFSM